MSILNKLDNVEMESKESKYTKADLEYFANALEFYNKQFDMLVESYERTMQYNEDLKELREKVSTHYYVSDVFSRGFIREFEDGFNTIQSEFPLQVIMYVNKTYNVQLSTEVFSEKEYKRKRESDSIIPNTRYTLDEILEDIDRQLDGRSFQETEDDTVKRDVRETIYNKENVELKKNKIIVRDFIGLDTRYDGTWEVSYFSGDKMSKLLDGISHFNYGMVTNTIAMTHLKNAYSRFGGHSIYSVIGKNEVNEEYFKSIKLFKNGRVDLEFTTEEKAREFMVGYLL